MELWRPSISKKKDTKLIVKAHGIDADTFHLTAPTSQQNTDTNEDGDTHSEVQSVPIAEAGNDTIGAPENAVA